jgi:hypothetical protein
MVGTTQLRQELIDAGAALVSKLDESSLQPDAAFWFYFPDAQAWKLVLAEVKVGLEGPKEGYRRIQRLLGKVPNQFAALSLDDVTLAKPDAPLVSLLRSALRTGPGISGIRFSNNVINGTVIEDAYICRLR